MTTPRINHQCAVCWQKQTTHDEWYQHARDTHDASLDDFGYRRCQNPCPGEEHARRLPNYGEARVPRQRPEPQPFTARDGTVYTPQGLPL